MRVISQRSCRSSSHFGTRQLSELPPLGAVCCVLCAATPETLTPGSSLGVVSHSLPSTSTAAVLSVRVWRSQQQQQAPVLGLLLCSHRLPAGLHPRRPALRRLHSRAIRSDPVYSPTVLHRHTAETLANTRGSPTSHCIALVCCHRVSSTLSPSHPAFECGATLFLKPPDPGLRLLGTLSRPLAASLVLYWFYTLGALDRLAWTRASLSLSLSFLSTLCTLNLSATSGHSDILTLKIGCLVNISNPCPAISRSFKKETSQRPSAVNLNLRPSFSGH